MFRHNGLPGLDAWITREPDFGDEPECDCADRAPPGKDWVCPECGAEWLADEEELNGTTPQPDKERDA